MMEQIHILLMFAGVGVLISSLLIPLVIRRATAINAGQALRVYHHTHKEPVPRLGGLAMVTVFVVQSAVTMIAFPVDDMNRMQLRWVILFGSLAIFALGFWDDLKPLGARRKLIGQILIATAVCAFGVRVESFQNPITGTTYILGAWGWVVSIAWLVALTNIINLVDGVDGLAGGICLMLMGLLVFAGWRNGLIFPTFCAAAMFGALVGFLRFNFPPAKIYMGDGGAYFLGFLIATLALVYSQKGTLVAALIAPLLALALPIVDVSLAIIRRGLRGLPLFRADREHIHHRLLKSGLSRTRAVLILYGVSALFLACAFVVFWLQGRSLAILLGFMFLTLVLMARMFDFSRHWFAVGRVWENSLEMRKETHYALALARWLELEAERSETIDALWKEFCFLADKLGFVRAKLILADGERTWQVPAALIVPLTHQQRHDLSFDPPMTLVLEGNEAETTPKMFEHLAELTVEAWLKSVTQWQRTSGKPLYFSADYKPAQRPEKPQDCGDGIKKPASA